MVKKDNIENPIENVEATIHQGNNIKKLRLFLRLSQQELAELVGVTQQKISDIEKEEVISDIELKNKIAIELGKYYVDNNTKEITGSSVIQYGDHSQAIFDNTGISFYTHSLDKIQELISMSFDKITENQTKFLEVDKERGKDAKVLFETYIKQVELLYREQINTLITEKDKMLDKLLSIAGK